MASAAPKFCIPNLRILVVSTAVLILLSGASTVPLEPRRCYWCGPLAEQVHRSVSAPSCEETQERVTTCEPEFTHCATVAMVPSRSEEIRRILHQSKTNAAYIESRLCVKSNEEECYSIYCNTTKILSMICPCRNYLCNGPNTEREKKAFAILAELVKYRKKRELITSSNFKSMEMKVQMDNTTSMQMIDIQNDNDDASDDILADEPVNENSDYNHNNESNAYDIVLKENTVNTSIEHDGENEEDQNKIEHQVRIEDLKVTKEIIIVTENSVQLTTIQNYEPSVVQNNVPPSAQLPPPEALQQNITPTEKTTEQTTIGTAMPSTHETRMGVTLEPNKTTKRNNGARIYLHISVYIFSITLQYYT